VYAKPTIFLAFTLVACATAKRDRDTGPARLVLYETPECTVEDAPDSRAQRVRAIMCRELAIHNDLLRHDVDRDTLAAAAGDAPHPVDAALAIVPCVSSGRCEPDLRGEVRRGSLPLSFGDLATLHHAASTVTPEMLRTALTGEHVGPELAAAFVERYAACRTMLIAGADALGPRFAQVYLAPLDESRRRWTDDVAAADLVTRYEALKVELERALLGGRASAELVDEVQGLRDTVVGACRARGRTIVNCLGMPIARPLTFDLVRLHIALGNGLAATAEARAGAAVPDRSELVYELHLAADVAMAVERQRFAAYSDAQAHATDPKVLAETFGPHAPLDLGDRENGVGVEPPAGERFDDALRRFADIHVVEDEVASVTRAGAAAVVHWKPVTSRYRLTTNCRETNKIDHITSDGDIIYRTVCTGRNVDKTVEKRKPEVRVPLAEARGLRPGDLVELAVRDADSTGRVIKAYAPGPDGARGIKQLGPFAAGR